MSPDHPCLFQTNKWKGGHRSLPSRRMWDLELSGENSTVMEVRGERVGVKREVIGQTEAEQLFTGWVLRGGVCLCPPCEPGCIPPAKSFWCLTFTLECVWGSKNPNQNLCSSGQIFYQLWVKFVEFCVNWEANSLNCSSTSDITQKYYQNYNQKTLLVGNSIVL